MLRPLEKITTLLHENYRVGKRTLKEINFGVNMQVPIDATGVQFRLYSFDKPGETLFPYFKKEEGVHKVCDYMLVATQDNDTYVLLIELKNGKQSGMHQLRAGACLARFIFDTLNRLHKLQINPIIRFITVHNDGILKKGRTSKKPIVYDTQNHCVFENSIFYIKEYLH